MTEVSIVSFTVLYMTFSLTKVSEKKKTKAKK